MFKFRLPAPASMEDVKQIKVITSEMVQNSVAVTGGESIVEFNGGLHKLLINVILL